MNARLERMRDDVRIGMGTYLADNDWADDIVDLAIKQGIQTLLVHFPSVTDVITLTETGYNHNLATYLPDIYNILDVRHPWDAQRPNSACTPYDLVGRTYIQFGELQPQLNDTVRVQYRRSYTLSELDGATTNTLPAEYEPAVVIAACSHLLRRQAMQAGVHPPTGKAVDSLGVQLSQMSIVLLDDAIASVYASHANHKNPVWRYAGL